MQVFETSTALREQVCAWRGAGLRIGFVPTMGNLHEGHMSLLRLATRDCDRVVASIFVNPTQFGPNEDFACYPRTPEADAERLAATGCHALFRPDVATLYPLGIDAAVRMEVPGLSDVLCGAYRPGHFAGVATVVARLFNLVQPDLAVFGRKDLQQLALIRHMVTDLGFPIEIVGAPTCRESDGLALSSRNQYLSLDERSRAATLHRSLNAMLDAVAAGQGIHQAEAMAQAMLEDAGFVVDYVVIRAEAALQRLLSGVPSMTGLVALGAARLGRTRLIDNVAWSERGPV